MSKTNDTTKRIIDLLNATGLFKVWRNNNLAVKGRTFIGLKGVPDITGHSLKDGKMVGVEVKTDDDMLSLEQFNFLTDLDNSGGHAYVAKSFDHFFAQFNGHRDDYLNYLPKKLHP